MTTPQDIAENKAVKFDTLKPKMSLVPADAVEGAAYAFTYGASKYARYNWVEGFDLDRLEDAHDRHMSDWKQGEDIDSESGLPHLDHAIACLMMLRSSLAHGLGVDTRPQRLSRSKLQGAYTKDALSRALASAPARLAPGNYKVTVTVKEVEEVFDLINQDDKLVARINASDLDNAWPNYVATMVNDTHLKLLNAQGVVVREADKPQVIKAPYSIYRVRNGARERVCFNIDEGEQDRAMFECFALTQHGDELQLVNAQGLVERFKYHDSPPVQPGVSVSITTKSGAV